MVCRSICFCKYLSSNSSRCVINVVLIFVAFFCSWVILCVRYVIRVQHPKKGIKMFFSIFLVTTSSPFLCLCFLFFLLAFCVFSAAFACCVFLPLCQFFFLFLLFLYLWFCCCYSVEYLLVVGKSAKLKKNNCVE